MDLDFEKNRVKPGDPNFVYDVKQNFDPPTEPNEWDDEEEKVSPASETTPTQLTFSKSVDPVLKKANEALLQPLPVLSNENLLKPLPELAPLKAPPSALLKPLEAAPEQKHKLESVKSNLVDSQNFKSADSSMSENQESERDSEDFDEDLDAVLEMLDDDDVVGHSRIDLVAVGNKRRNTLLAEQANAAAAAIAHLNQGNASNALEKIEQGYDEAERDKTETKAVVMPKSNVFPVSIDSASLLVVSEKPTFLPTEKASPDEKQTFVEKPTPTETPIEKKEPEKQLPPILAPKLAPISQPVVQLVNKSELVYSDDDEDFVEEDVESLDLSDLIKEPVQQPSAPISDVQVAKPKPVDTSLQVMQKLPEVTPIKSSVTPVDFGGGETDSEESIHHAELQDIDFDEEEISVASGDDEGSDDKF